MSGTADWGRLEERVEQAMCEVMLNDDWRHAPMLTLTLKSALEIDPPLEIKREAARLVELLNTPLADMTDTQRGDVANALIDLMRLVCNRGRDDA